MRIVTFSHAGRIGAGVLVGNGEEILDFTASALDLPKPEQHIGWFDLDGAPLRAAMDLVEQSELTQLRSSGAVLDRAQVTLMAPVPDPRKYICIGLNYKDHARESGMELPESPVVFSKFPTCVIGPDDAVRLPAGSDQGDFEAELAVIIGRRASRVTVDQAFDYVLGYTCTNDVSERRYQFADGQWQRGKSCDTFGPLGEYIATKDEIPDPHKLRIGLRLNGETMQDSNTDQLEFDVPNLVSFLSQSITLEPGDIIATGTPPGVGFARTPPVYLKDGDVMEVEIEGLGVLRNPVVGS
ncbi:MAG: fumarylacetoacetate hydrolase family protein [Planctomycetota bacterium]|nr:fumarylacetoacetate hydrolase family protein [Planctomycetota bacterium]